MMSDKEVYDKLRFIVGNVAYVVVRYYTTLLSGIQDHPQISDHTEKKSKKNKRPHLNKRPGGIFLKLVKSEHIKIINHTFEKT